MHLHTAKAIKVVIKTWTLGLRYNFIAGQICIKQTFIVLSRLYCIFVNILYDYLRMSFFKYSGPFFI